MPQFETTKRIVIRMPGRGLVTFEPGSIFDAVDNPPPSVSRARARALQMTNDRLEPLWIEGRIVLVNRKDLKPKTRWP